MISDTLFPLRRAASSNLPSSASSSRTLVMDRPPVSQSKVNCSTGRGAVKTQFGSPSGGLSNVRQSAVEPPTHRSQGVEPARHPEQLAGGGIKGYMMPID